MKKPVRQPIIIESISELHRLLELPPPVHPLVSVIDMSTLPCIIDDDHRGIVYQFWSVCTKKDFKGRLKYGQTYYDFDQGTMTFFAPGQVTMPEIVEDMQLSGWWLLIHPDFLRPYTLGKRIADYGYFSYAANEALHLSAKEDEMLTSLVRSIGTEFDTGIDQFTQDVVVSQIELVLNYCNRYYNRQFITRKTASSSLLERMEALLEDWFDSKECLPEGLPTVQYLASELAVSPGYLSDMLRATTGQSAQQHIHEKLIERSKQLLSTTALSVGEIAYQLGFSYPQSFNKFFKSKTEQSPLEFRQSFN
jgi:AraC family transcriptional activator of pobA